MDNTSNPFDLLIGKWQGKRGMDIAPESIGTETNPYYETILFEQTPDVRNAESQELFAIYYRQIVRRKSTDKIFHDQSGYWMWDAKEDVLMHSFTIPRAVCVLAKGKLMQGGNCLTLEVSASLDDDNFGIIQSPFMQANASTTSFKQKLTIENGFLRYSQSTMLDIYGISFEHTDDNVLKLKE